MFSVLFAEFSAHGKPTLTAFTTGFAISGACALVALVLCVPLARRRAVVPAVTETAAAA